MQSKEKIKQQIVEHYMARTQKSRQVFDRAVKVLPGGDTRALAHFDPYPFYAAKGSGCYLYDCDNNKYIDVVNNMTTLIHGHAHPHIVDALSCQVPEGTCHAAPIESQVALAEHICNRVDSIDMIRFCNSGTEATLFAMRGARAFTGRDIIVKIDGGYNGSHDTAQINASPDMSDSDLPKTMVSLGVPACTADSIIPVPFNDLDAMEKVLSQNPDRIAAVIVEPMMGAGGGILANDGYLKGIRDLTKQHDVLLILDEVITLRFHEGGYQAIADIKPDLTALGKIIGGGMAVGAFGGRKDIMEIFNPTKSEYVSHSGTLSGNAMTMVAGLACMEIYTQKEINRLNTLGDKIRSGFEDAMKSCGVKGQVAGYGSVLMVWFFEKPANNGKEFVASVMGCLDIAKMMHLALMNEGIYCGQKGFLMMALSTPMNEEIADIIIDKFKNSMAIAAPLAS